MPDTWQRCADGKWSKVMDLADGTKCTPSGLVKDITIEHDGSVDGQGGNNNNDDGNRNRVSGGSKISVGMSLLACTVISVWFQWGIVIEWF